MEQIFFKIGEAATLLGVGKITVYRLIWQGALKPVYIGRAVRIPRNELERFARELQETGKVDTQ
ncbi:MAG: helix-turn-helix domain-containing protein [Armatimonadota bacterium]